MSAIANLAVSVTAQTTQYDKAMIRVKRRLAAMRKEATRTSTRMRAFGQTLLTAVVPALGVAGVVGGLKRLIMHFEQFDQKMNQSLAIMVDATAGMRGAMERTAFSVAKSTRYSAGEAAEGYYYLASAGLSAQQALVALPKVAEFAQAGMFDLARATSLLADAQAAYGLKSKNAIANMDNMGRVADVLVRANTLANASVEQFSESLTNKAAAAGRMAGMSLEETVAALAAFAQVGVKGADAGNALNIVLRDMQSKALLNRDAFKKLGIEVYRGGRFVGLTSIIRDLERAFEGMGEAQKKYSLMQLGFTDRSTIFTQSLIGQADAMAEFEKQLNKAGGTSARVAEKQLTDWQKKWAEAGGGDLGRELAEGGKALARLPADITVGIDKAMGAVGKFIAGLEGADPDWWGVTEESLARPIELYEKALDPAIEKTKRFVRVQEIMARYNRQQAYNREALAKATREAANAERKLYDEQARTLARYVEMGRTQAQRRSLELRELQPFKRFMRPEQYNRARRSIEAQFADDDTDRALRGSRDFLDYRKRRGRWEAKQAAAETQTLSSFREIDLSRVFVGGPGGRMAREQVVKDPQLQQTNRMLTSIERNTRGGTQTGWGP